MLEHLINHLSLHYLSSGRLREVKNKGNIQTFSSKSNLTWKLLVYWKTGR